LEAGSSSEAAADVQLKHDDGRLVWGAGVDPSIEMAGLNARERLESAAMNSECGEAGGGVATLRFTSRA
jgi:hypothetical protein